LVQGYTIFYDGDIERAEIEVAEIMEKLDFNGNGTIDYSEFLVCHLDSSQILQEEKLQELFNMFDVDHSGTITADELKKVLGRNSQGTSGNEMDDNEWDKMIEEVDRDGNGEISFEEFK